MDYTQKYREELMSQGDYEFASQKLHLLRALVTLPESKKTLTSINYKSELRSGVRLTPAFHLTNDGLLEKTIYYYDGKPIIKISEDYSYNTVDEANTEMPISKRGIHKRLKKWEYYFEDGTLDESGDLGTFKVKEKLYLTDREGLVIGGKRRFNIQITLSERAGTALVIMGVFSDSKEVKDAMRNISATYSSNFNEYEKYGTESIYEDIQNDTSFSWLNTYIPTEQDLNNMVSAGQMSATQQAMLNGAFNAYDLASLRGLTIRQYFIEKLKGNLK